MNYRNTIQIKAPRFSRRDVLVAPWRVQPGINRIVFTETWKDKELFMDGNQMKSYPMEGNGKIECLAIPIRDFEVNSKQLKMEV